ncbi:autotransporter adhesin [Actinobacillus pleuropneumoniae]|uniref:YadA-like family protein n=1 Tax=Actinobacillus pleuropneumoniae TaxID=715 RepID=UPI000E1577B2|nr:autotransporter adhesin [Actinobacillus pleuropneumoniae]
MQWTKTESTAGGAISVGYEAKSKALDAIAIGTTAKALTGTAIAIGLGATSSVDGGVALGANSISDRSMTVDATKKPFIPATATQEQEKAINDTVATTGAVSLGKDGVRRQITNLAAGAEDSDAVNVAQLKAAVTKAVASSTWNIQENTTQKEVVNSGDDVNFADGIGTTATVDVNKNASTSTSTSTVKFSVNQSDLNVANNGSVTAVTKGDYFATAEQVAKAINDSEKTTVINSSKTITAKPTVNGTVTTYDLDLSEGTKKDIEKGVDAHTTVTNKGITFTADSGTETLRKLGDTLAINGDKALIDTTVETGKVSVAATKKLQDAVASAESALQEIETTANGVKAQTIKKDSNKANFTNGKNIKLTPSTTGIEVATKDDVTFTTVNATTVNGDTIKSGNVVINKDGINAGNQKITNVAKGTEDSDAVNYSQLKEYVGNNSSYTWNISDNAEGTNSATVSNKDTVAVQGSVKKDESTTKSGIVTKLDGKNITVDLSEKAKQELENGQKHSSVKGDTNVVVTQTATNTEGGKQFDVKLADKVVIGQGDNSVTIDGTSGTVSGLNNLTWDPNATYEGGKAATQEQLKLVSDVAQKGWNVQTNNDAAQKVAPGETVKFKDGKNIKVTNIGKEITIATADNVVTTDTDKYVTGGSVTYNDKGDATATLTGNNGAGGAITGVKNNFVTKAETATDGKKATLTRNDDVTVDIDLTNTVNQAVNEATEKGTNYEGDKADTGVADNNFKRKLGETTKVLGGAQGELSDNNIGVVSNGKDTLTVKLAKTLSGLTSATFTSGDSNTTIDGNGLTITPNNGNEVSLTDKGLNNGDNRITNVAKGQDGTDAVNLSQLKEYVGDNSYNWNISDGEKTANVPDNNTVSVKGSVKTADSATENGIVTKLDGTDITVDLSDKAKQDIADGKKHSSVKGDANVLVEVNNTPNSDGGKQYDVKLADTVVVGKDKVDGKPVTIDGTTGEISGLTNTTWNPNETYTGGKSATQEQLKAVSDVAHLGWNVQTNDTLASKVAPGETVKFVDGKNIKVTSNGKDITIATADNVVTTETDKYVTGGKVEYDNQGNGTTTLTLRDGSTAQVTGAKNNFVTEAETAKDGKTATLTRNDGGKVNIDLTNTVNQSVTEATDKGTKYAGDKADTGAAANEFGRKLGETTNVKGGAQGELSDNNIGVVSNGVDTLTVKLAKALSGLTSATFGSDATDQTVINKDGITINADKPENTVTLTDNGLNNGGNKITNVAKGDADTDAVNVSQLNQAIKDSAYNWNISDGKTEQAVPDNGKVSVKGSANDDSKATSGIVTILTGTDITVDLSDKSKQDIADGKKHSSVEGDANVVVTQTTTNKDGGKQYDVKLADKISIGSDKATTVTIDGTKGTVSGLTNTTWDPNKEYTGGQAATQEQLKSVSDVANSGWNISANGQNESNVGPKGKVSFNNTDGNVLISKETTDNNVTFNLNNDLTVGGPAGKDGKDGKDGSIGVKGADGKTGITLNGKDGSIGLTGAPGKDGQNAQATIKVVDGTKGLDGNNGKDGESKTRIVYEKPNGGGKEEIATLNDGLNFVGDKGQVIRKKLNDTLAIKGNLDAAAVVTDKNLRVDNDKDQNGELIIKMAKSLTDLTNATFSSDDSNTVIGGNGLTITPKTGDAVSLTDKGLNNGNNTITNVKAGENDTDAVNVSQLKEVKNTANAGWNISANGQNETNVAPKGSVSFNNTDGNVVITKAADNNNVTFNLNNDLTVGGPAGKDGKDGKDGTIGVKGKDGTTGVTLNGKDGSIGLTGAKGADGKDGANATITVANGPVGVDGTDGKDGKDGMTRIVYTDPKGTTHNVSTLNDGLNFAGNQGDTIAKKLNETLTVKGDLANDAAASSENLRVDSQDGALVVKLTQNLANLTTATFGNTDTDKTVVSKDGVTISSDKPEKEVSLTDKGLNNGNNQITNVTSGLTDSTGQKSDLANATTTNAVNVGDLKDTVNNLTNATTGGFGLKDDNNTEVKQDLGKIIQIKGKDGVTVTSDVANKSLEVALQGDVTVNGKDGKDGSIGVKGADGKDGTKITKDAVVFNGVDGKDGKDGQVSIKVEQGPKGIAGNDGKDGESKTRIVYEKPNGDKEQVATLNDGLNFVGDKGQVIQKKLNETLAIKGNLDANATVTDKNLRVDNDKDQNGELIIKMAKSLTDLTNATFSSGDINATIGGNGLTITPKGGDVVSLTDKGLNNGNNTITNVAPGVNGTDAVNKDQLDGVNATANAGWNLTTNGDNTNASNVAPNSTVDLANTDGNIVITKAGNNVTFDLNNNLTVGGPGKDGKDGVDGQLGVQGKDGKTGVALNGKDGTIGINGKDGSNGSITVKQGKPGVDGKDGETKTRIVYETKDETGKPTTEEVATLKDGLKFVGNDGKVVTKELNETLAIKGGINTEAGLTAASDRNVGVRENEKGLNIVIAERPTFSGITVDGKDGKDAEVKFAKDGKDGMSIVGTRGADGQNGLTLKGANGKDGVSFKEDGRITNVADGKDGKDAVNKDQLERVNATANAGWKLTINNGNNQTTVTPNATVDLANTDGNIVITKVGNNVNFGLNNTLTVGNDNKPGTMTVKGENGKDGVSISGKDGISIKGENGQDAVSINGKDGNGAIAVNGKDGKTGVGLDGANGTIGINGKDGSNGTITLAKGEPGVDGKDGKTRIVYETKTPDGKTVTEEVATLKDGLKFVGDDGKIITKELNETLTIKGNLSTTAAVTDKNLRVDNVDGALIIKMARTLTDLTNATFTNAGGDKSVVDGNGLTITPINGGKTVSLTTKGLDNGGNKVINVANGTISATSTDAVNGSQLYAVSEVANKGWNIQTNGNDTTNVKPGDTVNFVNGDNIAITNDGTKVTVGLVKNVDLGKDGSIKAGDTFVNKDGVKVGDNVSLTKDGLKAGNVTISATTGINAGDKQITNVASGLGGKKLSEAKGDTLTNAANIGDLQTAVSSVTDASQGGGFGLADDKGQEVKQNLGKTIPVKGDGKNISTVVKDGALTVNLNKDVDLGNDGSLTIGNTTINSDQVKVGDVTVSSNGKVSGVADGDISPNSTQAINGSQLYDANQNIANYLGGGSKLDDKGNVIAPTYTITKVDGNTTTANNVGDAITNLNNEVVKPLTFEGDTGVASKRKLGSTVTIKGGVQDSSKLSENNIGVVSDGKGTLAVKLAKDIKVDSVEAKTVNANTVNANTVKAGDTTINSDGVTIKDGPSVTKSGINAAGNRITNVKAGQADTDAVNVSQLKGAVGHVNQRINKVNKDLRAGIAGANAAAGLPQAYMPGKSMMAVAAGTYKNESALAVGYSRSSDNGKVILKLQGNANTRGDLGGSVGVGYQW